MTGPSRSSWAEIGVRPEAAILQTPHFERFAKWACGPIFCDRSADGSHTRHGTTTHAGDCSEGRGRPSRERGPCGRADQPGPLRRVCGSHSGGRPRALRARHQRAARLPSRVRRRCVVTGKRQAASQAVAFPQRRRPARRAPNRRAEPGARRGRRGGRTQRHRQDGRGVRPHPVRLDRPGQPDGGSGGEMTQEIVEAVRDIEREKGIESGTLVSALEDALLAAYKKTPGASRHATVEIDEQGDFRVYSIELPPDIEEPLLDEARERALEELERIEAENGERSHTLLSDDDLDIDWSDIPTDQVKREDVTPENFGRIAAQTAKQVILQRIREAERMMMYDEYKDRESEVVTGIVQQAGDRNNVLVDLGKVEALLPRSEQVDGERYEQGSRIKAVITEVRSGTKGPQVILSRRDPELIKTLFELEVPEIADGLVEIRGVAREPGYRSKIAVESHAQGVDPVGACVGPRGSRVRMVVSELRGEKIDIIPWNNEPARFVAKALSPARVREVFVDDESSEATVVVPDDQLALAIGKEGMNARLAARLTGWKVDIKSDTEFAQAEADAAFGGGAEGAEDFSGRCAAILANGKRCPNATLPGSKYCGVPAHQELALHDSDDEESVVMDAEPELEALADTMARDAESGGPSLPELEVTEVDSAAPADVAATHGPNAVAVAAAEGEVDLDTVVPHPQRAAGDDETGGIPIEAEETE